MSMFSSFLHPEKGYEAAEDEAKNYYNQAQGYQQPYNDQGQEAYGQLNPAMQSLLNPQQLQSDWMSGYEMSPQAQYATENATNTGMDLASSMGLQGSSAAIQGIQGKAGEISANDRQSYLNDLMQKYMAGVGIGQNIYNTGANSATQMGNTASQMGNQMSELEYGRTNSPGNMMNGLINTAATAAGTVLGGPMGGAAASWLTKK